MIRRRTLAFRLWLGALDASSAALLFLAVAGARFGTDAWATIDRSAGAPLILALGWAAAWVAILGWRGLYRLGAHWTWRREARGVVAAAAILTVVTAAALYAMRLVDVSRLFLLILFPAQASVTLLVRGALRALRRRAGRHGERRSWLLVVGTGASAQAFADLVEADTALAVGVVGHIRLAGQVDQIARPVLGEAAELERIVHGRIVDEVAICLEDDVRGTDALRSEVLALCREEGRIVRVPFRGDPPDVAGGVVERLEGQLLLSVLPGPDHALGLAAKRAVDVALAGLLLVVLAPLFAVIAAAMRLHGSGPAIFRQRRIGLHGRTFTLLKFRSMTPDAEERRAELDAHNEVQGRAFKLRDDPRLTQLGSWLRRTSLDELPQLWNVLRGDMSLVGPRPPLPEEVAAYDSWHRRRLSVRPGMTGLWQVEGRHDPEFDRWVRLDLEYIDRWSLALDLIILLRTVPVVMTLRGR